MGTADRIAAVTACNARTQNHYRELNEAITGLSADFGLGDKPGDPMQVMCECGRPDCSDAIEISTAEYEAIRANGAHFVLVLGHDVATVEHVVYSTSRYIVAHNDGEANAIAHAHDPRRFSSRQTTADGAEYLSAPSAAEPHDEPADRRGAAATTR